MSITRQNVWQQVLAQDALYNNYRFPNKRDHQHRNLYLRRRTQLSREYFQNKSFVNQDPQIRHNYCIIRKQLLCNRYGSIISGGSEAGSNSLRSKSRTPSLPSLIRQMDLDLSDGSSPISGNKSSSFISRNSEVVPTKIALASRALAGNDSVEEGYAFTGIQHIFDHCSAAVNRIRFAHNNASRLAVGCEDGSLSICCTWPFQEECVLSIMKDQHKLGITDLAWSSANDFILTASRDSTVCLWKVDSSTLQRIYTAKELNVGREILTVEFQPMNNNLFVAGGSDGIIQVVNLSTGKSVKGGRDKLGGSITALTFEESTGECLWIGNSQAIIQSYIFEIGTGKIIRAKRLTVSTKPCTISSLQARAWINREARDPCLLANASINSLLFFRIVSSDGQIVLKNKFPVRHADKSIHSCFCPLISFRQGACVVTGSEDGNVLVFDVTAGQLNSPKHCINVLQGHSGSVIDVAVSCDELVLASCDDKGHVILWKRVNDNGSHVD